MPALRPLQIKDSLCRALFIRLSTTQKPEWRHSGLFSFRFQVQHSRISQNVKLDASVQLELSRDDSAGAGK